MSKQKWPKLSEELTGPKHPQRCQSCGGDEDNDPDDTIGAMQYWIEHDDQDKPTRTLIILCNRCAKVLIERHPRLYAQIDRWQPHPGKELICIACKHRDGIICKEATFNGGPGVHLMFPTPDKVHICRSPRRLSGWHTFWRGPVSHCDRRIVLELIEE